MTIILFNIVIEDATSNSVFPSCYVNFIYSHLSPACIGNENK